MNFRITFFTRVQKILDQYDYAKKGKGGVATIDLPFFQAPGWSSAFRDVGDMIDGELDISDLHISMRTEIADPACWPERGTYDLSFPDSEKEWGDRLKIKGVVMVSSPGVAVLELWLTGDWGNVNDPYAGLDYLHQAALGILQHKIKPNPEDSFLRPELRPTPSPAT